MSDAETNDVAKVNEDIVAAKATAEQPVKSTKKKPAKKKPAKKKPAEKKTAKEKTDTKPAKKKPAKKKPAKKKPAKKKPAPTKTAEDKVESEPAPEEKAPTETAEENVDAEPAEKKDCPCCSEKPYAECCAPYISGTVPAPTAEALMRSRYTAYATGDVDYIKKTMGPAIKAKEFDRESVEKWANESEWLGLSIVTTAKGSENDTEGTVEFIAQYSDGKNEQIHHESAEFRKIDGAWYFIDGRMMNEPYRREEPKVGRNDACPCGSGKKFKKCCISA